MHICVCMYNYVYIVRDYNQQRSGHFGNICLIYHTIIYIYTHIYISRQQQHASCKIPAMENHHLYEVNHQNWSCSIAMLNDQMVKCIENLGAFHGQSYGRPTGHQGWNALEAGHHGFCTPLRRPGLNKKCGNLWFP